MKENQEIGEVVIVGGGPVGNLSAVLSGYMGAKTTVYQKRDTYTRQINLKIQIDLFKEIQTVFQNISRRKDDFFQKFIKQLQQKDGKILINVLQKTLKAKAEELGVKYVTGKQIKKFKQVYDVHEKNSPIILDCTGRNSFLRVNQFGDDVQNMKLVDLHHALHINFKTVISRQFDYRLIYSIVSNSEDIKLGDIVVAKSKQQKEKATNTAHVTIPLFISDKLSTVFDYNYPNINRIPLKPFSTRKQDSIVNQQVQNLLYSIFSPFLMQDWEIKWETVVVKKINITCGYAFQRSKERYVCLGDSAAHFAYFKSLNFGLKHSYELMRTLSSYHGFKCNLGEFEQQQYINLCKKSYPLLIIEQAKPGPAPCLYFIKTHALIYSAMVFNIAFKELDKLDILPVFSQEKVHKLWNQYVQQIKVQPWQKYLDKFQKTRQSDIDQMILSNKNKKGGTQFISYLIWLDGFSLIKMADVLSMATHGYCMEKKDLQFFAKIFKPLKKTMDDKDKFKVELNKATVQVQNMVSSTIPKEFHDYCAQLIKMSKDDKFTMDQFSKSVSSFKWDRSKYDYKRGTLYFKILKMISQLLQSPNPEKKY